MPDGCSIYFQVTLQGQQASTSIARGTGQIETFSTQSYAGQVVSGIPGGEVQIQEFQSTPEQHYTVIEPPDDKPEVIMDGVKFHEGDVAYVSEDPKDHHMIIEGSEFHTSSSSIRAVVQQVTRKVIRRTRRVIKKITIIDGKEHVTEEIIEEPEETEIMEEGIPRVSINVVRTEDGNVVHQQQYGQEPIIIEETGPIVTEFTKPEVVTKVTQQEITEVSAPVDMDVTKPVVSEVISSEESSGKVKKPKRKQIGKQSDAEKPTSMTEVFITEEKHTSDKDSLAEKSETQVEIVAVEIPAEPTSITQVVTTEVTENSKIVSEPAEEPVIHSSKQPSEKSSDKVVSEAPTKSKRKSKKGKKSKSPEEDETDVSTDIPLDTQAKTDVVSPDSQSFLAQEIKSSTEVRSPPEVKPRKKSPKSQDSQETTEKPTDEVTDSKPPQPKPRKKSPPTETSVHTEKIEVVVSEKKIPAEPKVSDEKLHAKSHVNLELQETISPSAPPSEEPSLIDNNAFITQEILTIVTETKSVLPAVESETTLDKPVEDISERVVESITSVVTQQLIDNSIVEPTKPMDDKVIKTTEAESRREKTSDDPKEILVVTVGGKVPCKTFEKISMEITKSGPAGEEEIKIVEPTQPEPNKELSNVVEELIKAPTESTVDKTITETLVVTVGGKVPCKTSETISMEITKPEPKLVSEVQESTEETKSITLAEIPSAVQSPDPEKSKEDSKSVTVEEVITLAGETKEPTPEPLEVSTSIPSASEVVETIVKLTETVTIPEKPESVEVIVQSPVKEVSEVELTVQSPVKEVSKVKPDPKLTVTISGKEPQKIHEDIKIERRGPLQRQMSVEQTAIDDYVTKIASGYTSPRPDKFSSAAFILEESKPQSVEIKLTIEEKPVDKTEEIPKVSLDIKVEEKTPEIVKRDIDVNLPTKTETHLTRIETKSVALSPIVFESDTDASRSEQASNGHKSRKKKKHKDKSISIEEIKPTEQMEPEPTSIESLPVEEPKSIDTSLAESTEIIVDESPVVTDTPKPTMEELDSLTGTSLEIDAENETGYKVDSTEEVTEADNKKSKRKRKHKQKIKDFVVDETSPAPKSSTITVGESEELTSIGSDGLPKEKTRKRKIEPKEELPEEKEISKSDSCKTISPTSDVEVVKVIEERQPTPLGETVGDVGSELVITVPVVEVTRVEERDIQTSPEEKEETLVIHVDTTQVSQQTSPEVPKELSEASIQVEEPVIETPKLEEISTQIVPRDIVPIVEQFSQTSSPEQLPQVETIETYMQTMTPELIVKSVNEGTSQTTPVESPEPVPRADSTIQTVIESEEICVQTDSPPPVEKFVKAETIDMDMQTVEAETIHTAVISQQTSPEPEIHTTEISIQTSPIEEPEVVKPVLTKQTTIETVETSIQAVPEALITEEIYQQTSPEPIITTLEQTIQTVTPEVQDVSEQTEIVTIEIGTSPVQLTPEQVKSPEKNPSPVASPLKVTSPVKVPSPEVVKSPTPEPEVVKSPTPEPEVIKSPTPEKEASPEIILSPPLAKSPEPKQSKKHRKKSKKPHKDAPMEVHIEATISMPNQEEVKVEKTVMLPETPSDSEPSSSTSYEVEVNKNTAFIESERGHKPEILTPDSSSSADNEINVSIMVNRPQVLPQVIKSEVQKTVLNIKPEQTQIIVRPPVVDVIRTQNLIDRTKKLQQSPTQFSSFLDMLILEETLPTERIVESNNNVQDHLENLQQMIQKHENFTVIEQTFITTIETITTWLETIEYRIIKTQQHKTTDDNQLKQLNSEITEITSNINDLQNLVHFTEGGEEKVALQNTIDTLQQQVEILHNVSIANERKVQEDCTRWRDFISGIDNVTLLIEKLRTQLDTLLSSDVTIQEKLDTLEQLDTLNKAHRIKIQYLLANGRRLTHEFPTYEIPKELFEAHDLTKYNEYLIDMERERALQLITLAEEYQQTLQEFAQITEIANDLVDGPINVTSLEHLQEDMQKHRKFFVNLSHCRSILESLEGNLDSDTRAKHSKLHQLLHQKATTILDNASGRLQQMALAASKWTVLEQGKLTA